ncbi:hypothetical protein KRX11_10415 [Pasteurellaceae bacterium TAE3-ERU1]|nr:hypothetical protein [Pasteurellaceae bacterium TAE3-ERU1]
MMGIIKNITVSILSGVLIEKINSDIDSDYLYIFFNENLISILIALLAINSTTMGIVLTKIRDLVDKINSDFAFKRTKDNMLLSIREQITLIILGIVFLSLKNSKIIENHSGLDFYINAALSGILVYALFILYDTAKSVLIIINYNPGNNS